MRIINFEIRGAVTEEIENLSFSLAYLSLEIQNQTWHGPEDAVIGSQRFLAVVGVDLATGRHLVESELSTKVS